MNAIAAEANIRTPTGRDGLSLVKVERTTLGVSSTVWMVKAPIHAMLVSFPVVCFIGALVTDLTYWSSAEIMWADFSIWLITAGLVFSGFATLVSLIRFVGDRTFRTRTAVWLHLSGDLLVFVLSLWNAFVHSRDAWTSVVPTGLALSAMVAVIALCTGWLGLALIYLQSAGVSER